MEGFDYWGNKKKSSKKQTDDDEYTPYGSTSYGGGSYGGYSRGYSGGYSKGGSTYRRSYSYADWNWGTYGSVSTDEEDDKDLYIKSHPSYFTPTNESIEFKLDHKENTKRNRSLIKEFARYFYHRMIEEKEYFDSKYDDPTKLTEEEITNFSAKKQYYEDLWTKFIPGITPLEQALSLFSQLQKEKKGEGELADSEIAKTMEGIEFHEELYKDPEYNELLEMQKFAKDNKLDILNKIALIKNLGSQFKIEKEITEKIVQNSQLISKKIMRDYSQLTQVDLYQRLMPTFNTKLLTKDLVVNTPVDRTEHKQKIIILLDFSGSMRENEKQKWVLAVLIDRLKYVMKEEAEIFFSYFVHNTAELHFHHAYDRASALQFWQTFSTSPNGGDTALGDMINYIKNQIEVHKKLCNLNVDLSTENPEILAINDGQDSVKTNKFTYKTNAITLVGSENQELKKLCIENEGKYVYISSKGKVKTYEKGIS